MLFWNDLEWFCARNCLYRPFKRVLMSVKEWIKWSAVAPSPRAACFAARSALSLPGTPTWEGTHCRTMSVPRVMSWWHTTISLTTPSLEDWLLCLMACSADSESEKNRHLPPAALASYLHQLGGPQGQHCPAKSVQAARGGTSNYYLVFFLTFDRALLKKY